MEDNMLLVFVGKDVKMEDVVGGTKTTIFV